MKLTNKFSFFTILALVFFFGLTEQAKAITCDSGGGTCQDSSATCFEIRAGNADCATLSDSKCCAIPYCNCFTDLDKVKTTMEQGIAVSADKVIDIGCAPLQTPASCSESGMSVGGKVYDKCELFSNQNFCIEARKPWLNRKNDLFESQATHKENLGIVGALFPSCIINDTSQLSSECTDIGIFVLTGINMARFLFGIVGALSLLMFVYGGFILILSQGMPEKIKQGTGIMTAAVIGLIIAFGGYLLVQFLGSTVGLKDQFKLQ